MFRYNGQNDFITGIKFDMGRGVASTLFTLSQLIK